MSPGDWGRRTIQIVKWAVPLVAHGQQLVVSAEYRIPTMHGVTCGLGDSFERHRRRAALTDQPSPGLDRAVGHGSPTWVDPAGPHGLVQCARAGRGTWSRSDHLGHPQVCNRQLEVALVEHLCA